MRLAARAGAVPSGLVVEHEPGVEIDLARVQAELVLRADELAGR